MLFTLTTTPTSFSWPAPYDSLHNVYINVNQNIYVWFPRITIYTYLKNLWSAIVKDECQLPLEVIPDDFLKKIGDIKKDDWKTSDEGVDCHQIWANYVAIIYVFPLIRWF